MSPKFRPRLESFENRVVPASFSFRFADGTVGSGYFDAPAGIDPGAGFQQLDVPDLAVVMNGQSRMVYAGAWAEYDGGVLVGVDALVDGPDGSVRLDGPEATFGEYTAPLAFDGSDTRESFTLGDGTRGAISYTVPWASVDETLATQYLTPTAFNLNIAGQNFASGSGSAYTDAPTLVFASGNFVGFTFTLAPAAGFAYTSVAAAFDINGNNIVEAIMAGSGQQFIAAPIPRQSVDLGPVDVRGGCG